MKHFKLIIRFLVVLQIIAALILAYFLARAMHVLFITAG